MKKLIFVLLITILPTFYLAQASLVEAKSVHENTELSLVPVDDVDGSVFLGKMEIINDGIDETTLFNDFYKKAKLTGANAYQIITTENINQKLSYDRKKFQVHLYYIEPKKLSKKENRVYLFAKNSSHKVRMNHQKIMLQPRSFLIVDLNKTPIVDIAVGGFLGSRIELKYQVNQPHHYFEILGSNVKDLRQPTGGLKLKSGDFLMLEKSYAEFLTTLYTEQNF